MVIVVAIIGLVTIIPAARALGKQDFDRFS